jgi:tRNA(Arg) A34 adenosine deaminase TadA
MPTSSLRLACISQIRKSIVRSHSTNRMLETFCTYNWIPDRSISEEENFIDLTLLVTRSSKLKHGSMACILVRNDSDKETTDLSLSSFTDRIISVSTNQALYKENESDIHAEIVAIGQAAKQGRATLECTAYITMPPCRKCFAALLCAGVRRIVSRHESPLSDLAAVYGIEMICLSDWDGQRDRTLATVQAYEEQIAMAENDIDGTSSDLSHKSERKS